LGLATALAGCAHEPAVVETPPLEVVVSQPVQEKIVDWDTYTGTVESKKIQEVRAQVNGKILKVCFKEGDDVKAGADLFVIDSQPFEADKEVAKGQLKTWEGKLVEAEKLVKLREPLEKKGTVSTEELLAAIRMKTDAEGGVITAKGKIKEADVNIGYCKITADVTGKVGDARFTEGNIVSASGSNNLLTTVVPFDPMYVEFYVNERALLNYLKVLQKVAAKKSEGAKDLTDEIPVQLARLTDEKFDFDGVIDFIDNKVDPNTGSIKVRARFPNPKGKDGRHALTAGLFARIRVAIADPYPAILVADRAILTDQNLKYVLVVNKAKKNTVERVDIRTSGRLQPDGLRAVEAGLNPDQWVIVEGITRARPGITVAPKEEKMPRLPVGGK
jgi:multidrug efflux system membrane fusion protein